jgi:hypothetical protein
MDRGKGKKFEIIILCIPVRINSHIGKKVLQGALPLGHLPEHDQFFYPGRILLVFHPHDGAVMFHNKLQLTGGKHGWTRDCLKKCFQGDEYL